MDTERVRVSELKVGDVFLRGGDFPCKIVELTGRGSVYITTEYVGDEPDTYNRRYSGNSWSLRDTEYRLRVVAKPPRTCAPCRDSDCDCIFDMVGY